MPSDQPTARKLIYTQQGEKWLNQFDVLDQEVAKLLVRSLTLVSHNEFRRSVEAQILETAANVAGPVGLYAVRELKKDTSSSRWNAPVIPFFQQVTANADGRSVNALDISSDQGSEAIVAQMIRQISKANPEKFLNHPTKQELKARQCDALLFADDFIGSGRRVSEFIEAFWRDKTVVSWLSSKHINIQVVAYSGTEEGIRYLERRPSQPELNIHRDAPTFASLPLGLDRRKAIHDLCTKYGRKALKNRKNFWLGFHEGMASLVFEHGCPNNTPAILWDPDHKHGEWIGLFPNRVVSATTASVFPPEIVRGDAITTLRDVGQTRLANSGALLRRGEIGTLVLLVLGLVAKGQRKRSTICYATGMSTMNCQRILTKCVKWQFLTPECRLTARGRAELNAARRDTASSKSFLDVGSDYYYPQKLRVTAK